MNLSTKSLPAGSNNPSKTLLPGNKMCKINSINLEKFTFKEGAYNLMLHLESEDMGEDFDGFFVDKDDPTKGKYKGQIGRVRAGEYAFSDAVTRTGIEIKRDLEILKFIKNICIAADCEDWFNNQDEKYQSIEEFVEAFNAECPFKDKYINWCLAGKEYVNKAGYTNYDLFLPKFSKSKVPFESPNVTLSKLIQFNKSEHIRTVKSTVSSFEPTDDNNTKIDSNFTL